MQAISKDILQRAEAHAAGLPEGTHPTKLAADLMHGFELPEPAALAIVFRRYDGTAWTRVALERNVSVVAKKPPASRGYLLTGSETTDGPPGNRLDQAVESQPASPNQNPSPRSETKARLVRMDSVAPKSVDWLWPGRIALGKLTLLAGDPGLGKSFLTLDLAARVSQGARWPDGPVTQKPGGVVLLGAEDDIADTVRPRLDAAGADPSRIIALTMIRYRDVETGKACERQFSLEDDLDALEEAIDRVENCRLVVIDPVSAYLGNTDSHVNAAVRALLSPLADLAGRRGIAVLAVTHLNKGSGAGQAIYRMTGSLAFAAAARAVWLVAKDQENNQRRLLLPVKNNIGADSQGLAFSVTTSTTSATPVVAWESGPVTVDANDALTIEPPGSEGGATHDAMEWLKEILSAGPMCASEVKKLAADSAQAWRTVERAKTRLGVVTKAGGFGKPRTWMMPEGRSHPKPSSPPVPPTHKTLADMGGHGGGNGREAGNTYDSEERAGILEFGGG